MDYRCVAVVCVCVCVWCVSELWVDSVSSLSGWCRLCAVCLSAVWFLGTNRTEAWWKFPFVILLSFSGTFFFFFFSSCFSSLTWKHCFVETKRRVVFLCFSPCKVDDFWFSFPGEDQIVVVVDDDDVYIVIYRGKFFPLSEISSSVVRLFSLLLMFIFIDFSWLIPTLTLNIWNIRWWNE